MTTQNASLLSDAEDRVIEAQDDFAECPCLGAHWALMLAEAAYLQLHLVLEPTVDLSEIQTPTLQMASYS